MKLYEIAVAMIMTICLQNGQGVCFSKHRIVIGALSG